jgi:CelD/BcsL family acetyltransferase involved in cellulose biosynthesis
MIVRLLEGRSLTPDQIAHWSRIQQGDSTLSSPFFCPEFTSIVASARDDVLVAVLEQDGRPAGFFPFQRGRWGVGRPVGWQISDYQGVIAEPGMRWNAKQLLRACGLKTWEFDHLIGSQSAFEPFWESRRRSPFIDVSNGIEAYLEERRRAGARAVTELRRKMRKLEREQGALRFAADVQDPEALDALVRWKSDQYLRTGAADVLARAWIRRVLELAHRTRGDGFSGLLSVLYAGDRVVAMHMGIRSSTVWHYWFPAYDPALARYSPGLALILKMAESAPSLGIEAIDLGKGEARYKLGLMSGAVPLAEGRVDLPSLGTAAARMRRTARSLARRTALGAPARRLVRRILRRG